jgi:hypothetical protein
MDSLDFGERRQHIHGFFGQRLWRIGLSQRDLHNWRSRLIMLPEFRLHHRDYNLVHHFHYHNRQLLHMRHMHSGEGRIRLPSGLLLWNQLGQLRLHRRGQRLHPLYIYHLDHYNYKHHDHCDSLISRL